MNVVVVPAKNEQGRIGKVLTMLKKTPVKKIIAVVNGTQDNTFSEIKALKMQNIKVLYFKQELGIDVPRAIGAYQAFIEGAEAVIFVDGDMIGNVTTQINDLIFAIRNKNVDLALTNCYPQKIRGNELTQQTLAFRKMLNQKLGIYNKIGVATPSHGPHGVSRRLLEKVNFEYFAVPPVVLAFAVKNNLKVDIATILPHEQMGSKIKNYNHAKKIADTIIGDTIEAINCFNGKPREREYCNLLFDGYNSKRRFDILRRYIIICSKKHQHRYKN